jgi:hypothetical protein
MIADVDMAYTLARPNEPGCYFVTIVDPTSVSTARALRKGVEKGHILQKLPRNEAIVQMNVYLDHLEQQRSAANKRKASRRG